MTSLADFFEISHTSESQYTERQLEIIEKSSQDIGPSQLPAFAYCLIDLFATQDKSRVLRSRANDLLQQLARSGSVEHQCELGEHYLYGRISPPAESTAAEAALGWLTTAYEQGSGRAAFSLSNLYGEVRSGVQKDVEKSEFYLNEARRLGDSSQQLR